VPPIRPAAAESLDRRRDDRSLRSTRVLVAVLAGAWLLSLLLSAVGPAAAGDLFAGGGKLVFLAGLAAVLALRSRGSGADRWAWVCFSTATSAYLAGAVVYAVLSRSGPVVDHPGWSDLAYTAFYPCVWAGLVLMLRSRARRVEVAGWLDAVVTGLTAAALAADVALSALLRSAHGSVGAVVAGVAYPVADLLLLVLVAGSLAVIGRGAGPVLWWLTAGLAVFVLTDTGWAAEVVAGTYTSGGVLDLGWGLGFACFGLAACSRQPATPAEPPTGRGALVVPGCCAVVALALLLHGYLDTGEPLAGVLAVGAVAAALARTAVSFRSVRALADTRRLASTDELTGLANRRRVYEELAAADDLLAAGEQVAVLVLDLDRFKEINDSLGHAVGDALLCAVGPRLREHLRAGDLLGRTGGDEFVVISRDLDAEGAEVLATRIQAELRRPFAVDGLDLSVDVSTGIAVGPGHAQRAEELLQLADLAMYAAKAQRTGTAVFDEQRDGGGRHRLDDVAALRRGIADGELVLHYQPKLSLATGRVDGVEALVRWQHPERGLVYPDGFIDLAESAGLMGELTDAVVELALKQARLWAELDRDLTVAVNVSPSNLVDEGFPDTIAGLLVAHGVPAGSLVLEVTESLLMQDRARAQRVLGRLREQGVGVAIDDYGTGYSSLAYLAELPVTELKLDRAFIAGMTASWRAESIVISTLQLAHALGLVLVAEGAEDQETVDLLLSMGCDVVQGYHLSRPLPAAQLDRWLDERSAAVVGASHAG
jgi:diguanylate cyclase (GGDEF)-like protein